MERNNSLIIEIDDNYIPIVADEVKNAFEMDIAALALFNSS